MILALGEEVRPALCQPYKCSTIVKFQPAQANREAAGGFLWIAIRAIGGVFHQTLMRARECAGRISAPRLTREPILVRSDETKATA